MTVIHVTSSDGHAMQIPQRFVQASKLLTEMLSDNPDSDEEKISLPFPLHTLKSCAELLSVDVEQQREKIKEIVEDQDLVHELLCCTEYLDTEDLLNLLCQGVAQKLHSFGTDYEKIRNYLYLVDDLTEEEKEAIELETQWCKYMT